MAECVFVLGVGMVPFTTPSRSESYDVMGERAARLAVEDAGIEYDDVQQAFAGYVFGDSTYGQAALYGLGQTSIPIVNVNNNCSTGSSALYLARQAVAGGNADVALALGFEQMQRGALAAHWTDRPSPFSRLDEVTNSLVDNEDGAPMAARYFGGAGAAYARKFGLGDDTFAKIAVKARTHAANNPYAVFRDQLTVEEVLGSPHVFGPLTRLQCCPPTCGAAAAVLCSESFARAHGLTPAVAIKEQVMTSDSSSTFTDRDMMKVAGYDMSRLAADRAYDRSGVRPSDIDVVELHDCFTTNELITYEALGLTPVGTAEKFVNDGDNTYGGKVVVNPSGGLLSKGHPLGATGLAQCAELVWQLRGEADARQVAGARLALQHNIGLGGACVVTIYEKIA
ncbi:lipid-transfer protein [Nocardia alni]|uniref:lipid-transfer protein n=1 Tax=Nocardia alni TaxID=2815723 RepID=UPI001C2287B8|nr:lipid-transfer protein [Nocardia alni]